MQSGVAKMEGFKHIYDAGKFIQLANTYELCGLGCAIGSGALCGIGFSDNRDELKIGGIVLGVGALICEIASYSYHFKSGKELKIGAGCILYNF